MATAMHHDTGNPISCKECERQRDDARAVLRDLLEQRGLMAYRERLVVALGKARAEKRSSLGGYHTGASHGLGTALDMLDDATAGALRPPS